MISEELKKMFEGRIEMQDIHYVGKACYGRLEENLRGKIELGQGFMDSGIPGLPSRCWSGPMGWWIR